VLFFFNNPGGMSWWMNLVIGWSIGGSGGNWIIVVVAVEMDNRCQAVVMDKENFVLEVLHKQKIQSRRY
jgi:hypothetical protein